MLRGRGIWILDPSGSLSMPRTVQKVTSHSLRRSIRPKILSHAPVEDSFRAESRLPSQTNPIATGAWDRQFVVDPGTSQKVVRHNRRSFLQMEDTPHPRVI